MAGRKILEGVRVLDIFYAEPAQCTAPMCLGVVLVLLHDTLVHGKRSVKLALPSEMIAAVEHIRPLLVVHLREGHRAAAVFACPECLVCGKLDISSTHFAF